MKNIFMGVVVPYSILLPIFIALLRFKSLSNAAKILLLYLVCSGLVSIVSIYLARWLHVTNIPLFHIYTMIELVLLTEFYKKLLPFKRTILIVQLSFIVICILNSIFLQSIYKFNSYTLSLGAFIIMLFAVNYFAKLFSDISDVKLVDQPAFWFNTGMFLYFSGSNMLYIFSNYILTESKHNFLVTWNTRAAFLLIMYLLFTLGFLKCKK